MLWLLGPHEFYGKRSIHSTLYTAQPCSNPEYPSQGKWHESVIELPDAFCQDGKSSYSNIPLKYQSKRY